MACHVVGDCSGVRCTALQHAVGTEAAANRGDHFDCPLLWILWHIDSTVGAVSVGSTIRRLWIYCRPWRMGEQWPVLLGRGGWTNLCFDRYVADARIKNLYYALKQC